MSTDSNGAIWIGTKDGYVPISCYLPLQEAWIEGAIVCKLETDHIVYLVKFRHVENDEPLSNAENITIYVTWAKVIQ